VKTVSGQCDSACERFSCRLAESGRERITKEWCAKSAVYRNVLRFIGGSRSLDSILEGTPPLAGESDDILVCENVYENVKTDKGSEFFKNVG